MNRITILRRAAAMAAAVAFVGLAFAGWHWHETTHWFTASELDRPAQPTGFINPDFPDLHAPGGYLGKLRIDVYIDETGAVARVDTIESTLPPLYAERAAQAFGRAKFEPARRFGRPVRSVKRFELDIEPPPPGGPKEEFSRPVPP